MIRSCPVRNSIPYTPFLRAVDVELQAFKARPHWGKLHFLDRERMFDIYPEAQKFQTVRKEMDPENHFLNPHFQALFG